MWNLNIPRSQLCLQLPHWHASDLPWRCQPGCQERSWTGFAYGPTCLINVSRSTTTQTFNFINEYITDLGLSENRVSPQTWSLYTTVIGKTMINYWILGHFIFKQTCMNPWSRFKCFLMLSDAFAVWVGRQDGLSTFSGHISARDVNAKQGIHRSWWVKPWKSDCCLGWWSPSRGFIRTQIAWPPHNCRNMKYKVQLVQFMVSRKTVTHLPRPIQKGFHPETCLIFQKAFNHLKKK